MGTARTRVAAVRYGGERQCARIAATHYLQPLDRSVFGPLNKYYNSACSEFLKQNALNLVNK
ncbi:hypothetical protein DPMN_014524 [Dreissena polymorpha]|uniref:Uncharacterized protein n=1 Tax=Dreissena polymorpha TaxID=45954 RepID=A0A9D4S4R6_DREPO|nr:hypothetical protein DPMN_014524 [Dreissena polymorpha]